MWGKVDVYVQSITGKDIEMQQKLMNVFGALAENHEQFWNSALHNFRSQKEDVCRQREVFGHYTRENIIIIIFPSMLPAS